MKKAMKKLMVAGVLCMAGAAFLTGCGSDSSSGGKQFLNIATGGTAGTYYPLGGALAEILNQNIKGMNASAQSTGASVANVNMLKDGSVDIEGEVALFDGLLDVGQARNDVFGIFFRDYALGGQHACMSAGAGNILMIHCLINRKGRTELLREFAYTLFKTSRPQRHNMSS